MWVRILLPVNIISSCDETGSTRQLEVLARKLLKVQILSGRLYMVVVAQRQSGVLWTLRSRFQNSPTTLRVSVGTGIHRGLRNLGRKD